VLSHDQARDQEPIGNGVPYCRYPGPFGVPDSGRVVARGLELSHQEDDHFAVQLVHDAGSEVDALGSPLRSRAVVAGLEIRRGANTEVIRAFPARELASASRELDGLFAVAVFLIGTQCSQPGPLNQGGDELGVKLGRTECRAYGMTTFAGSFSSEDSSTVISRSRKARIVCTFVRRCSVTSETVNSLRPGAKARGSKI
jgi:hypothetical protein